MINILLLISTLNLIKVDIYDCTKPGLMRGGQEANYLAKQFTDRNMYDELFIGACFYTIGVYSFTRYGEKLDGVDFVSKIVLLIISISEIKAINSWDMNIEYKYLLFIQQF